MRWLLSSLLVLATPALADEQTLASAHHRDYPTSTLYLSPADASRFNEPALGILLSYSRSLTRTEFTSGQENDDALGQTAALRLVRKANPSLYWGFTLTRYDEHDEANNTLITGDRKVATRLQRSEAGLEAAYKFMDKVVLGLGLKYRQVATRPDSGKSLSLTHPVLESSLLARSEWYEAELSQRILSYEQAGGDGKERQFRREVTAAVRYHSSAALTTGLRFVRNPVPACCLAPASARQIFAVSAEIQTGDLKNEVVYAHKPASHDDGVHVVTRNGLAYTAFFPLTRGLTVQGTADVERGEEKNSEVRVATASGVEDEADVEAFACSVGLGVSFNL